MSKPPEEGLIWEWRAFGQPSESFVSRITSHKVRMGIIAHGGTDVYLVSPSSEHNIKLRKWNRGWLLKFKLFLERRSDCVELYSESARHVFRFPLAPEHLQEAASLLNAEPTRKLRASSVTRKKFLKVMESASPSIKIVEVTKTRSQYDCGGGWIELADVSFPRARVRSVSIHSTDLDELRRIISDVEPDSGLEVMNYLDACRRWG